MADRSLRCLLSTLLSIALVAATASGTAPKCKYLPGDPGWPTAWAWTKLNQTVGGRLITTTPQASVCHTGNSAFRETYNEAACETLETDWAAAQTFEPYPAEIINPYYQNQSCDPFTPTTQPCVLGNYAVYSINVSSAQDVAAGLQFARENNVRLVVKTTGHDYTGRSSGRGVLSLWTWNLKTSQVIPSYRSSSYSGPAVKLGSGLIAGEASLIVGAAGYRLVGGECATVGIAAGYSQGGGHSILNMAYGMAADQVLEWELVTPSGQHLVATPTQNSDLYWAHSGGGGGTYGIVLSMTAKIHKDGPIAGGTLTFANTDNDTYYQAVSLWLQQSALLTNASNSFSMELTNEGFEILPTLLNQPASAVAQVLAPYLAGLDKLNVTYQLNATEARTYAEHFGQDFGPLPYGDEPANIIFQNRLVTRNNVDTAAAADKVTDAFRSTIESGKYLIGCISTNVTHKPDVANAVLSVWRQTTQVCGIVAFWDYSAPLEANWALKDEMVHVHQPAIETATPGGAVYLNEVDPWYQGDWKSELFGANYGRLLSIKHKYDPEHLLWGRFTVASDGLALDEDGRLCAA